MGADFAPIRIDVARMNTSLTCSGRSCSVIDMEVRPIELRDKSDWLRMRSALWSDSSEDHEPETEEFFRQESPIPAVFVAGRPDGRLGGFLECGSRDYAEGYLTSPVGYIEGWWVDPDVRGQRVGALLISAAENWARSQGYTEIASDADLNNEVSQLALRALGYEETQRIVCCRKQL